MKYALKVTGAGVVGGCLSNLAYVGYTFGLSETWHSLVVTAAGAYSAMAIAMIIIDDQTVEMQTEE